VRDGGTGMLRSFPTGTSLPSPDRAPGLGHLPALPQRRRDGRASGVPVSGPRSCQEEHLARRHLHYRPAMPLELPGTDWGCDPPPTGNERERERERERNFIDRIHCLTLHPAAADNDVKPHSARTGRTVFSQYSAAVMHHKANGAVVCAI